MSLNVFVAYSHVDQQMHDRLVEHLAAMRQSDLIEVWHDEMLEGGVPWRQEIVERLEAADVVLMLLSPSFLDSQFCMRVECKRALERNSAGEARLIPVILHPVDLQGTGLEDLQAVPKGGRAVTEWSNPDSAYLDIVKRVRRVIADGNGQQLQPAVEHPTASVSASYRIVDYSPSYFTGGLAMRSTLHRDQDAPPLLRLLHLWITSNSSGAVEGIEASIKVPGDVVAWTIRPPTHSMTVRDGAGPGEPECQLVLAEIVLPNGAERHVSVAYQEIVRASGVKKATCVVSAAGERCGLTRRRYASESLFSWGCLGISLGLLTLVSSMAIGSTRVSLAAAVLLGLGVLCIAGDSIRERMAARAGARREWEEFLGQMSGWHGAIAPLESDLT